MSEESGIVVSDDVDIDRKYIKVVPTKRPKTRVTKAKQGQRAVKIGARK